MKSIYMVVVTPKKITRTIRQRLFRQSNPRKFGNTVQGALKKEWAEEFIEMQSERDRTEAKKKRRATEDDILFDTKPLPLSIERVPFIETEEELDDFDSFINGG